jgi:hypothetical protein
MYLHIGNGKNIKKKNIVGIFDIDNVTVSKTGKDFINRMEKKGLVEYDYMDIPRSFVLFEDNGIYKVNLSRISTQGLKIRVIENILEKEEITVKE